MGYFQEDRAGWLMRSQALLEAPRCKSANTHVNAPRVEHYDVVIEHTWFQALHTDHPLIVESITPSNLSFDSGVNINSDHPACQMAGKYEMVEGGLKYYWYKKVLNREKEDSTSGVQLHRLIRYR